MTTALPTRRLLFALAAPAALILLGTVGYKVIEGWSLDDSLWMTVITLTTIGYGETHPLDGPGRVFTMVLAMSGIFSIFFAATIIIVSFLLRS